LRFGMAPALWGYFTQSARSGQVRRDNAPEGLARSLDSLPPGLILQGQVETVALCIDRAR
jgi:hypothetical protein